MRTQAEDIASIRAYIALSFWLSLAATIVGWLVAVWGTMATRASIAKTAPIIPEKKK